MPEKLSHDELVGLVKTPGWKLVSGRQDKAGVEGTLEDVLRESHERRKEGMAPGLIRKIETEIELDMIQIEKLWWYLGLPL
jgi:hypothetical protein